MKNAAKLISWQHEVRQYDQGKNPDLNIFVQLASYYQIVHSLRLAMNK